MIFECGNPGDETGLTIIGDDGLGVYFPDNPTNTNILPLKGGSLLKGVAARSAPTVSIEKLYPHWGGEDQGPGQAVRSVRIASTELHQTMESICCSELELTSALVLADSQLFKALKFAGFNKALELVLYFCAWALRNGENEIDRLPQLQGICSVLNELEGNPFLSIDRATQIILDLEEQGWSGESPISRAFENSLNFDLLDFPD